MCQKTPKTMYLVCKTVTLFEDFVFHYIQTWEGFTLCISCIVQWQNVCLALLLLSSANAHSLKEKTNGFKPNGPFEVTSTSFKGSSFTLPPQASSPICSRKALNPPSKFISLPFPGWLFWLCSVVANVQYAYLTDTFATIARRQTIAVLILVETMYILRDFSKNTKQSKTKKTETNKQKKKRQKKEQKHFIVLCVYMKVYVWILKKCIC